MPKIRSYSDQDKAMGLSALEAYRGDALKASKFCGIPANMLLLWQKESWGQETPESILTTEGSIPMPPEELVDDLRMPEQFLPAHELAEWFTGHFVDEKAAFYNEDHWHLKTARIGFLWTNVGFSKAGNTVAGTAEIPQPQSNWPSMRWMCQLAKWFGEVPDALVTFDAVLWARASNATRCARLDHEAYHLAIKTNRWGEPLFDKYTGGPKLKVAGHHVEEFVPCARRWGVGSCAGRSAEFVRAASQKPLFGEYEIDLACGLCS